VNSSTRDIANRSFPGLPLYLQENKAVLHFFRSNHDPPFPPNTDKPPVMYSFDPSFDRGKHDAFTAPPFGLSPDGHFIVSATDLPQLAIPKHVAVTRDFIELDGWVFPFSCVSKSLLVWLQQSSHRWVKEDDSDQNRQWINGIWEAFQDGLCRKL
jgi:hypothetical protein